jgi:hypothetical protein
MIPDRRSAIMNCPDRKSDIVKKNNSVPSASCTLMVQFDQFCSISPSQCAESVPSARSEYRDLSEGMPPNWLDNSPRESRTIFRKSAISSPVTGSGRDCYYLLLHRSPPLPGPWRFDGPCGRRPGHGAACSELSRSEAEPTAYRCRSRSSSPAMTATGIVKRA